MKLVDHKTGACPGCDRAGGKCRDKPCKYRKHWLVLYGSASVEKKCVKYSERAVQQALKPGGLFNG